MRNIADLRIVKDRRPFEPSHLHLADGRDLRISHPDNVAWNAGDVIRTVFVGHDGGWEVVDLTLIVGVRVPNPASPPDEP